MKVGLIVFGHPYLDHLVHSEDIKNDLISKTENWSLNIDIFKDIVKLPCEAIQAARYFRKKDVDIVIIYLASYGAEELTWVFCKELSGYPIILWSTYSHRLTSLSVLNYIATTRNLTFLNYPYFSLIDDGLDDKKTYQKIMRLCNVATIYKKLGRSTIGIIGAPNYGQIDTIVNEFEMRKIVPGLIYLDTLELVELYKKVDREEAFRVSQKKIKNIKKVDIPDELIINALSWYMATKSLIKKFKLDAITIRSWPELKTYQSFDGALTASMLNEDGIVCIQEIDISATITALILYYLSEIPVFCGEITSVDFKKNTFILFHCGEAAFSLASDFREISLTKSPNYNSMELQLPLKPGKVTLAKLTFDPNKNIYKMIVKIGISLPFKHEGQQGVLALIKPNEDVKQFIHEFVENNFEHHIVMAYGDYQEELLALCKIMEIKAIL